MQRYYALVNKDKDSAYGVSFPDIPAVYSAADKEQDILHNAIEALQLYFEDLKKAPRASSIDHLTQREDVQKELSEGAFFISVPLIENDTAVVRANVSFPRGLLHAVDDVAKAQGLSRSAFLASAARQKIEA